MGKKIRITIADAFKKERQSWVPGRFFKKDTANRQNIGGHDFLVITYSVWYSGNIGWEYRFAIFIDGRSYGGGIIG